MTREEAIAQIGVWGEVSEEMMTAEMPVRIDRGRWKDLPRLLARLGLETGVEVGVHAGNWAYSCLRHGPQNLILYGVDPWEAYPDYRDYVNPKGLKTARAIAFEKLGSNPNWIPLEMTSMEAVEKFGDESLDFVYIDGNHAYEYVVADIAAWSKKIKPGGLVMGHDYASFEGKWVAPYMQVMEAVDGWMGAKRILPWFLLTRRSAGVWMYVK